MTEREQITYDKINKEVGALISMFGWSIVNIEQDQDRYYAYMEHSEKTVDYESILFDGTKENFVKCVVEHAENFNIDDRVEDIIHGREGQTIQDILEQMEEYHNNLLMLSLGLKYAAAIWLSLGNNI